MGEWGYGEADESCEENWKRRVRYVNCRNIDGKSTSLVSVSHVGTALLVKSENTKELKVLKRVIVENKSTSEHLQAEREGKIMKRLVHGNVVTVTATFTTLSASDGELAFNLLQEYCEGGDLSSRVKEAKKRNISLKRSVVEYVFFFFASLVKIDFLNITYTLTTQKHNRSWFAQICSGLSYIHKSAVIHRDICAKNLFLCRNDRVVKIGDFGVSKDTRGTRAMAKTSVGTPLYLSPEIVNGRTYDTKTDIWSLGCVLYELLTLRPPFVGSNIGTLVRRIASGHYRALPMHVRRTSCGQMVGKLLSLNPRMRPSASSILSESFVRNALHALMLEHHDEEEKRDEKTRSPIRYQIQRRRKIKSTFTPPPPLEHRTTLTVRRRTPPDQRVTRLRQTSILSYRENIDSAMRSALRQIHTNDEQQQNEEPSPRVQMRREKKNRDAEEAIKRRRSLEARRRKFFEERKQKKQDKERYIKEHHARHRRARTSRRKDIKEFIRQRRLEISTNCQHDEVEEEDYVGKDVVQCDDDDDDDDSYYKKKDLMCSKEETDTMSKCFRDVAVVKLENRISTVHLRTTNRSLPLQTESPGLTLKNSSSTSNTDKNNNTGTKDKIKHLMTLVNRKGDEALKMASMSRERSLENQIEKLKRQQVQREQELKEHMKSMKKMRSYWFNILRTTGIPLIKFGASGKPKRRMLRIVNNERLVWGGRKKRSIMLSDIRSAKRGIRT